MANIINTRIQLKNDTEENWKKSVLVSEGGTKTSGTSFVPLQGELIIFSADDTHPFPRFKVGDGETTVVNLPFTTHNVIKSYATQNDFPSIGATDSLYIDLSTRLLYYYTNSSGYLLFSTTTYTPQKTSLNIPSGWSPGQMTTLSIEGYSLKIENGTEPSLTLTPTNIVTDVTTATT